MNPGTTDAAAVLESRWFGWSALLAAALLISPTFSLGFLSSTFRKAAFFAPVSAAYATGFYLMFNSQLPGSGGDIPDAYRSLSIWTSIVGSVAPFLAGAVFRFAWTRTSPKVSAAAVVAAFGILAYGSSIVTEKVDNLAEVTNLSAGRAEALSVIAREAVKIAEGRRGAPEFWAAQYLATKAANEILGVAGPATLEEYIEQNQPTRSATEPAL